MDPFPRGKMHIIQIILLQPQGHHLPSETQVRKFFALSKLWKTIIKIIDKIKSYWLKTFQIGIIIT